MTMRWTAWSPGVRMHKDKSTMKVSTLCSACNPHSIQNQKDKDRSCHLVDTAQIASRVAINILVHVRLGTSLKLNNLTKSFKT